MSDMSDFFKRMAEVEQGTTITGIGPDGDIVDLTNGEPGPRRTFAEQAIDKAIYALEEIIYFAQCGRPQGCLNEATDALALIKILAAQHESEKGAASPEAASNQPVEEFDE